jgi:hypothetical protein
LAALFSAEQRRSLSELAESEWPANHLTLNVATAIDSALADRALVGLSEDTSLSQVVKQNSEALARAMGSSWGIK